MYVYTAGKVDVSEIMKGLHVSQTEAEALIGSHGGGARALKTGLNSEQALHLIYEQHKVEELRDAAMGIYYSHGKYLPPPGTQPLVTPARAGVRVIGVKDEGKAMLQATDDLVVQDA